MTLRLRDQSAARCKNYRPVSPRNNGPTVGLLATMIFLLLEYSHSYSSLCVFCESVTNVVI